MSGFEKMNTEEREPFPYYVVKQQNRALSAAIKQKDRKLRELGRSLQEKNKAQQTTTALVSCVERHWRQLEGDAKLLLQALGGGGGGDNGSGEEGSSSSILEKVLLGEADKFLLADISKVAEAAATDPLDDMIKYDDESGEGWAERHGEDGQEGGGGGGGSSKEDDDHHDEETVSKVDKAVQERCQLTRRLVQRLTEKLAHVTSTPTVGASSDNHAHSAGESDGKSPPSGSSVAVIENTQRLQAQVELFRDRLTLAKKNQEGLYKGLIRALKERHRLLRPADWGMEPPLSTPGEEVVKMEEGGGEEGREGGGGGSNGLEGGEHGEHKAGMGGNKRKRSSAGGGGGGNSDGEENVVRASELAAAMESNQELKEMAEKRLEEIEKLRDDKAGLVQRVTSLSADLASFATTTTNNNSSNNRHHSHSHNTHITDDQVTTHSLYRLLRHERDALLRDRQEDNQHTHKLRQEVTDLQGKLQLLAQSRQEAIDAERKHFVARTEELARENQQLKRTVDEYVLEVEARRELVRQADELKAQLDEQRAEATRVKEISAHQAKEVAELRTQWSQLQERLTAREEEVSRLSAQVLEPLAPDAARQARIGELEQQLGEATEEKERLAAFQTSLFQETESLTAAYEELSQNTQRLKQQVEEKEKRNNRLTDDMLRTKATEKLQLEKAAAIEKKALAFEHMRRQQEEALKTLQEQVTQLTAKCTKLGQERAAAEEKVKEEVRNYHQAQRALEEMDGKLKGAEGKAVAMTKRAEELGKELSGTEGERFKLQEQVTSLQRKLQKTQGKLEASGGGGGGGGGGAGAAAAGGGAGAEGGTNAALLKMLNCSVCNSNWKNCVITKCYHLFCTGCIQENLRIRHRKCPACGKHFSESDVKQIYLT